MAVVVIFDDMYVLVFQNIMHQEIQTQETKAQLMPCHTWALSYEILFKLNILRKNTGGLAVIAVPSRVPLKKVIPQVLYEQAEAYPNRIGYPKILFRHTGKSDTTASTLFGQYKNG